MDLKLCIEAIRNYIDLRRLDADAPAYPNRINYVLCYTEDAGQGTYGLRLTAAFRGGKRNWSEAADVTIYCEGVEIGEANNRMVDIQGWLHKVICEWGKSQQKWTLYSESEPHTALMPSEAGAMYVTTFAVWTTRIPEARA